MSLLGAVAPVARRQHGLITIEQLRDAGITAGQLRFLVADGPVAPVRRRVYRMAANPTTWAQAVLAAVLAGGPDAVASHRTAGALWRLQPVDRHAGVLHVTAPRRLRLTGVTAHARLLTAESRRTVSGIPVTSAERTIVDLAASMAPTELGLCVDDALRRRLIRLERLHRLADRGIREGPAADSLARLGAPRPVPGSDPGGSDWERQMDRLWERLGLPPSERQYTVKVGDHRYVLDRAIPELKIGVEWNGFDTHGTRSGFDRDSDRRADLTAAGWHMVDFTSRSSPDRLVAAVTGAVRARTAAPDRPALHFPLIPCHQSALYDTVVAEKRCYVAPPAACWARRQRRYASMNPSRSPSRTACTLPVS
jgi:hypothetical protein